MNYEAIINSEQGTTSLDTDKYNLTFKLRSGASNKSNMPHKAKSKINTHTWQYFSCTCKLFTYVYITQRLDFTESEITPARPGG